METAMDENLSLGQKPLLDFSQINSATRGR
jgi:hypothetical protein